MRNGRTPTNILTLPTLLAITTVAAFWSASSVAQTAVACKPGFEFAGTVGGEARCTPAAGQPIAQADPPTAAVPAAPQTTEDKIRSFLRN
jgi:hypothetical protein